MPNAIVAPQPLAVEEGAKVLMAGGNAIDAAVTAAFVQAIVSPQMCGIGGYALLTLHSADEAGPRRPGCTCTGRVEGHARHVEGQADWSKSGWLGLLPGRQSQ